MGQTVKEPNNLRNRWRRYRATRKAYGFTTIPFREWAKYASLDSYSAGAYDRTVEFINLVRWAR